MPGNTDRQTDISIRSKHGKDAKYTVRKQVAIAFSMTKCNSATQITNFTKAIIYLIAITLLAGSRQSL